ncbi:DUF488 domain-containing protein [Aminobacter sp. AP02]|uniref:DUF488 domain-containing protein n=1 Tax=Aminobacter sp. AP02 TaxID=2135737 RepID=UPI000D6BA95E|nr:DUF488 domain-containing protein [Aminobacter sp. AP02]PWK72803.1 uncharacterized protein YeaO (DUF488 family) [Aminobacter sp. AP02]
MGPIRIKRIYETATDDDGFRVLVDRVWPRGITREKAAVDIWLKEIGPSTELRKWFGHDPARWDEFRLRYRLELAAQPALLEDFREQAGKGALTLVYSAHDEMHNQAVVLKEFLEG